MGRLERMMAAWAADRAARNLLADWLVQAAQVRVWLHHRTVIPQDRATVAVQATGADSTDLVAAVVAVGMVAVAVPQM